MAKYTNIEKWGEQHREEFLDNAYMEIGDTFLLDVGSVFDPEFFNKENIPSEIVTLCNRTEYLNFVVRHVLNMRLFPYQYGVLNTLWTKRLPIFVGSRGCSKTMMIGLYATVRALINQGIKIVIAGAGLRQSGLVFEKMQQIWDSAPVLRDIVGGDGPKRSILGYEWKVGTSQIIGIPIGNGEKIRGLRANIVLADEFASINPEVFETVLRGFAAVQSQDTFEKVQEEARKKALEQIGLLDEYEELMAMEENSGLFNLSGNQIILTGTCSYQFNHFYKYYKSYCDIILNKGHMANGGYISNWQEYAVVRVPYDHLPDGLMDKTILEQGAGVMDNMIFQMEYAAVFPADSAGFYPASILEGATCPISVGDDEIRFEAELHGKSAAQYVMGIDPASERDNLTISITKLADGYKEHVYSWSANRRSYEDDRKKNRKFYDGINDYNTFIIRKIHELCSRFNIVRLHLDSGGGGVSIVEGLKDPTKVRDGESLLFDMDDPEVAGEKGLHIIRLCQFTKRDWYEAAHYNLLKDLTARNYLFPQYDSVGVEILRVGKDMDPFGNLMYDTPEGIYGEIEQVKYQTALIEEQSTAKGLKKWDLPKLAGIMTSDIADKLRKDHFTSLLLVNDAARDYLNTDDTVIKTGGYYAKDYATRERDPNVNTQSKMYQGRGLGKMRQDTGNTFKFVKVDQGDSDSSVFY